MISWNRVVLLCAALVLIMPTLGTGQTLEVFAGYSLARMKPENGGNSIAMSGWNTSVATYFTRRVGVAAEGAGFYGTLDSSLPTGVNAPVSLRQYMGMAGPQIRLIRTQRFETSIKALFGAAYGHVPENSSGQYSQTTFASQFGSNIDFNLSKRVAIRFSPGVYLTQFGDNSTQKNFRISVGPVFRVYGKSE